MAQAGFTPILLYYSTTAAASPSAGNLANGELAINITDGKLFYKDNGGVVRTIAGTGGTGIVAGSSTQLQFNNGGVFGASANLTWDGTNLSAGGLALPNGTANGVLYLDGSKVATSGSALTFDGTNLATTGTSSATKLIPTGGSATGNGMYLPAANALAWSNNGVETMRLDASGNLGIGTASPGARLHINDASTGALIRISSGTNNSARGIEWWNNNSNNVYGSITSDYTSGVWTYDAGRSVYAGQHVFRIGTSGEGMRLNASGNLGIGTASPSSRLHILGGDARVQATTDGANGILRIFDTAGTAQIAAYATSSTCWFGTTSSNPLAFTTNNTERMRLDASGNLGIGTSSPGSKVHAYDTSNSKILSQTTTGYAQFQASSTSGDFHLAIDNSTGAGFGSGAYARLLYSTGAYPIVFSTNAAERMRLDASGNVIVGTAALATTATAGFPWIPSCAGIPTGAPTAPYTNAAAMVVDTTNNRLYVRVGSTWRYATLT